MFSHGDILQGCEATGTPRLLCGAESGLFCRRGHFVWLWAPSKAALLWSPPHLWGWALLPWVVGVCRVLSVLSQGQVWEGLLPLGTTGASNSPPGLLRAVPGCGELWLRLREGRAGAGSWRAGLSPCSALTASPRLHPPSRQGARWAPRPSRPSHHLPLSFRGRRQHGTVGPGPAIRLHPRAALRSRGGERRRGAGRTGPRGCGRRRGPGWLGKGGSGAGERWAWAGA